MANSAAAPRSVELMEAPPPPPLRRPPVSRTPWLSASCGLGFGQSQLGATLLRAAESGDGGQVRRITNPLCSSSCVRRVRWGTAAAAGVLALSFAELRRLAALQSSEEEEAATNLTTRIDLIVLATTVAAMILILLAMLQCMPDPGITANWTDDWYRTPLHLAAAMGHVDVISILLDEGAVVEAKDWRKQTPLFYAAAGGHIKAVEALLSLGADLNAVDELDLKPYRVAATPALWHALGGHDTTLHSALRSTEVSDLTVVFVAHLLHADPTVVNLPDQQGAPPLVLAVLAGRTDIVRALLERGADVNLASSPPPPGDARHSDRIQQRAAAVKQAEVKRKCSPCEAGGGSNGAAAGATKQQSVAAVNATSVVKQGSTEALTTGPRTPLFAAAERGDLELMQLLIDAGANPDGRNPLRVEKSTARSSQNGMTGKTASDGNGGGDAPLHLAAEEDDVAVLTLLLDSGAQIDARNASQQTALTIAIVESSCEAIALLIARGASCAVDDDEWIGKGSTPLHYVSARGRLDVVKQLLASVDGAVKINALDARGFSPLHHAVRSRKVAVVQALLDAGADASLPNSLGLSGKQLAATRDVFCGFEWPE